MITKTPLFGEFKLTCLTPRLFFAGKGNNILEGFGKIDSES